ncbi:MAG: hypothetical protein IR158_18400 [Cellulomonas sp.]|uniref:hypothetical protein n=1 Tax=Cellulomonas sp. TaxID=40001 RepID=UPI0019F9CC71|nr:hypothetical protein [Cellulomonas sp.]MBF0689728.1 hypothetical protein [Cellulomonas sp.]
MSTTDPQRPGDAGETRATPSEAADTDTGRHAVQRPAPTPPRPATASTPGSERPDPVVASGPARTAPPTSTDGAPTAPATPGDSPATPGAPARDATAGDTPTGAGARGRPDDAPERPETDDELFPDPHAPRTPHAGTHVLGVLVGLVLAPAAIGLLLLGQSRILDVQVEGWDASLELLGIVLVSAGALLLAALLVLGLWTAAVPVTAGLLLGALGGIQLYAPGIARATTLEVVDADAWSRTATQVTVAGTSGTTIAAAVLLLAGGVVTALARRHGVRLGTFRERNRTA